METQTKTQERKNVYFFWDYDLTEADVRAILRGEDENRKVWVMSRILNYALWEDIWKYVTVKDVRENFERIWWRTPYFKDLWKYALEVWQNVN